MLGMPWPAAHEFILAIDGLLATAVTGLIVFLLLRRGIRWLLFYRLFLAAISGYLAVISFGMLADLIEHSRTGVTLVMPALGLLLGIRLADLIREL